MRIFGNTGGSKPEYLADSSVLHPGTIMELTRSGFGYFSFHPPLGGAVSYLGKRDFSRMEVATHTVKLKHCRFYVGSYGNKRLVNEYLLIEDQGEAAKFAEFLGRRRSVMETIQTAMECR